MSSLRRLFPGIALTCKGILLFMCGAALIALFAVSPVIFGCVPSVVSETDSGAAYPAGALVYHRYTPAETLAPGDAAVVYDAGRTTVCTILSRDDALRTLLTEGHGPIPFEHVEGRAVFCVPLAGKLVSLFSAPAPWIILAAAAALLLAGAFLLPRYSYAPKYVRSDKK